ncbi:MAG: bifunctional 5,10-methylenetetrahydrofolate dehydrogenase/5,10-methenyltetrahydrofolate cyclohydrolase [Candidatus Stygibacter australis]|nr:bifunctional 5,10-methylenetetrahydrofolate dehydrogenase/5,10-methenyltetrahydrofolate cyclohydrolase [Candidatus Stygibacter australis]MDP8321598.1 bifunctional 5,10-methylenetetrahydrofolate dehydrogenase/5,10-methenyltetrahydrofolate cyclohydrolase [Candidatus Stygibacter australis]
MAELLKAKPVLSKIYTQLQLDIDSLNKKPCLEIILIGEDAAAEWYVSNLQKKGTKYGVQVNLRKFSVDLTQEELENQITELNNDDDIDGIMLQKPLPEQIDEHVINSLIKPSKDVDGFHPINLGKLMLEQPALLPCTPQAVIEIIKFYQIETTGKHIVILGRSNIVGKPLGLLLLSKTPQGNATVTICHSKTQNLSAVTQQADILIVAIGKAEFVKPEMIKENSIIIDVGTNLMVDAEGNEKYVGDVDAEAVFNKAFALSPVPGGVGSVTTALLLANVVKSVKLRQKKLFY